MVVYSAADLLWASKIKGVAEDLGVPCRPVRSVEMLESRLADSEVRALILDLDAPERAWALLEALDSREGGAEVARVRVLAFGPHVAKDLLQAARDRGADEVLTRGAFDHALPEILLRLESGASR
ncbi:MAG: hypothetical protein AAGK04_06960 [Planctomycetota bacterium]